MILYSVIINSNFDEVDSEVNKIIGFLKEKCNIYDLFRLRKPDDFFEVF